MERILVANKGNRRLIVEKTEFGYSAEISGDKFPNLYTSKTEIRCSSGTINDTDFLDEIRLIFRIQTDLETSKNADVFSEWIKKELDYKGWSYTIV